MATKGFEFAYALDGSTPLVKDVPVAGTGAYKKGDLLTISTYGTFAAAAGSVATVAAVCMEARSSGVDAGLLKAAILTKNQVWRCSSDGTTLSAVLGAVTQDIVDANTIDADDPTNGSLAVFDTGVDDDGNVLVYVGFTKTVFG